MPAFPHRTYDREFPETAPVADLDHARISMVAQNIAKAIRRDLNKSVDRSLVPGLRSALRMVIDADRRD